MSGPTDFYEKNPKTCMFVCGILVALLLVLVYSFLFKAEHVHNIPPASVAIAPAFMEKLEDVVKDPRFFSESMAENAADITRPTPAAGGKLERTMLSKSQNSARSEQPVPNRDNDLLATEHMLTRGSAERSIQDVSRNRYLGMAKLGGEEYEGYVYRGEPTLDEQGELTATVYGISESPWN